MLNPKIPADHRGVHITHCCARHGCKYGDNETCAVYSKGFKQKYPCMECQDAEDLVQQISELQAELAFVRSLSS